MTTLVPAEEFILKATRNGETRTHRVLGQADYQSLQVAEGDVDAAIEWDGICEAIKFIMNRSDEIWTKGRIELFYADGSPVINKAEGKPFVMEEK